MEGRHGRKKIKGRKERRKERRNGRTSWEEKKGGRVGLAWECIESERLGSVFGK